MTATLGSNSGSAASFATAGQQSGSVVFGLRTAGNTDAMKIGFDDATLSITSLGDAGFSTQDDAG